jgi:CheY-like chemotaxis protein
MNAKGVVIVDDEAGICEILRDVFEDEGYWVGVATDGAQALHLLKGLEVKPCVVILDLLMPVLDGNALLRAMKADPALADIRVVVSTSDPSQAPPGVPILKKPVPLAVLIDLVRRSC